MRIHTAVLSVLLPLIAGCSTDAEPAAEAIAEGTHSPQAPSTRDTDDNRPTGSGNTTPSSIDADAAGPVETVRADDAGEVDLRIDDNRLELVEVREASGWSHTLNKTDHDEVELDFHHDSGRALRLEVELEDGRLKVQME